MEYDLDRLQELVQFMERHGLAELEVADSDTHVRLRRPEMALVGNGVEGIAAVAEPEPQPQAPPRPAVVEFKAPMVGTFRRAPESGEPFIHTGSTINPKSVLCIIEAMSVPNEIRTSLSGTVTEILAEDGQPVEYGTPLFRIAVSDK